MSRTEQRQDFADGVRDGLYGTAKPSGQSHTYRRGLRRGLVIWERLGRAGRLRTG